MRLLSIRAKEDGVGHYRISIPALALRERGHTVDILDGQTLKGYVSSETFAGYDAIVIQKARLPQFFHHVRTIPLDMRPKIVYEMDDLTWNLHPTNPSFQDYAPDRENFKECVRLADGVTCSTEELAHFISEYNPKVKVIPNCIDTPGLREWEIPEPRIAPRDCVVIGWLGGIHHIGDEVPMAEGMRHVMEQCPETVFAFCGNPDLETLWKRSLRLPAGRWLSLPPAEFDGYQTRISQFDIGVAPLAQGEFNRCKSDLRLLEYQAWGVPYVASNITPYRMYHIQSGGIGGYLANHSERWGEMLYRLVTDFHNRQRMGTEGREWVRYNRGSDACGEAWEKSLLSIIDGDFPERFRRPETVGPNTFCPCHSGVKYKRCCSPAWG